MTDSVYTEKPKNFLSSSLQKKKKNQPLTQWIDEMVLIKKPARGKTVQHKHRNVRTFISKSVAIISKLFACRLYNGNRC